SRRRWRMYLCTSSDREIRDWRLEIAAISNLQSLPTLRREVYMFVVVRAVTYAALFIGLVLIYVPARLLSWSGIARPVAIEVQQVVGMIIGATGAVVALWCI